MWRGQVQLGQARRGIMRQDAVTADDLSTEGFGPLCWVPRNPDVAWKSPVDQGVAVLGRVRHGAARVAKAALGA